MRIALYQPDIPQNTGTILRLAACFDLTVDIIGPTGFDMTDRALRRSGLDYLKHVKLVRHISFDSFLEWQQEQESTRLILLTTHGEQSYLDFSFKENDILLLGRESSGAPEEVHKNAYSRIKIPIHQELRSLNIAMATAIVTAEALRQTKMFP